jgi:hypothetical protein
MGKFVSFILQSWQFGSGSAFKFALVVNWADNAVPVLVSHERVIKDRVKRSAASPLSACLAAAQNRGVSMTRSRMGSGQSS